MIFILILALAILLVDQISKLIFVGFFIDPNVPLVTGILQYEGESISVIDNVFSFTYVLNNGAAFGILKNQRFFFLLATVVICVCGILLLLRLPQKHLMLKLSSGFILGGALGNLIDRVIVGSVRDFLDATFIETITTYSFPVFNVADIFVVCGVIMLGIYILFIHDKIYPEKKQDDKK